MKKEVTLMEVLEEKKSVGYINDIGIFEPLDGELEIKQKEVFETIFALADELREKIIQDFNDGKKTEEEALALLAERCGVQTVFEDIERYFKQETGILLMFRDREMLDDCFQVTRKKNKVDLNEKEKRIRRKIFEKNLYELEKKIALKHPDAVEEGLIKQGYKDKYTNEWRAMIVQCFIEFKKITGHDLHFRKRSKNV